METNLRPQTLGEILDRTAQLYRENFLLFAGIAAVYAAVVLVLSLTQIGVSEVLRVLHWTQALKWVSVIFLVVLAPLMFIFAGAAVAANNRAVAWVHLGEPATIASAYRSILPRLGRYLWLMTIAAFMVWTPFVVVYGGYMGFITLYVTPKGLITQPGGHVDMQAAAVMGIVTLVFLLLAVPAGVYAVWMALRYALAVPAAVVENLPARKALKRSVELSKGARGRLFVLALLVVVIQVGLVLMTQLFFIIATVKQHGLLPAWMRALQQIVGFATNSFIGPMYATGLTLFYYDQRVRKEGYDIEWMMQAAGLTVPEKLPDGASESASELAAQSTPGEGPDRAERDGQG